MHAHTWIHLLHLGEKAVEAVNRWRESRHASSGATYHSAKGRSGFTWYGVPPSAKDRFLAAVDKAAPMEVLFRELAKADVDAAFRDRVYAEHREATETWPGMLLYVTIAR